MKKQHAVVAVIPSFSTLTAQVQAQEIEARRVARMEAEVRMQGLLDAEATPTYEDLPAFVCFDDRTSVVPTTDLTAFDDVTGNFPSYSPPTTDVPMLDTKDMHAFDTDAELWFSGANVETKQLVPFEAKQARRSARRYNNIIANPVTKGRMF